MRDLKHSLYGCCIQEEVFSSSWGSLLYLTNKHKHGNSRASCKKSLKNA